MNWEQLLSTVRVRTLFGGDNSLKSPGDPRDEFERDYGRAVFSSPVRRLQDKAQVFPLVTNDFVRTRLTHSFEVSSVSRGLGGMAASWMAAKGFLSHSLKPAIETIAATCGMIHDLGNPPFGHAGDEAISEWCSNTIDTGKKIIKGSQYEQDFARWNGNAQTIRLVGRLQVLSDMYGLNLTAATMSSACKYVAASNEIDKAKHERSKLGHFFSETTLVQKVRETVGTGKSRHPITFLVEASDDIVYSCCDLEDGVKRRLIRWEQLEAELLKRSNNSEHIKKAISLAKEKIGEFEDGHEREEALAQALRTYAINEFVLSALQEFKNEYEKIIAGDYHYELTQRCTAAPVIVACKSIAKEVVYRSEDVLRIELLGRRVIHDLLSIFWEAAESYKNWKQKPFAEKAFLMMSSNYRKVFLDALSKVPIVDGAPDPALSLYYRLQLVCDYVAGMTDTFATNLHKSLTNA